MTTPNKPQSIERALRYADQLESQLGALEDKNTAQAARELIWGVQGLLLTKGEEKNSVIELVRCALARLYPVEIKILWHEVEIEVNDRIITTVVSIPENISLEPYIKAKCLLRGGCKYVRQTKIIPEAELATYLAQSKSRPLSEKEKTIIQDCESAGIFQKFSEAVSLAPHFTLNPPKDIARFFLRFLKNAQPTQNAALLRFFMQELNPKIDLLVWEEIAMIVIDSRVHSFVSLAALKSNPSASVEMARVAPSKLLLVGMLRNKVLMIQ